MVYSISCSGHQCDRSLCGIKFDGQTYQFDSPAFCVTGAKIRKEILATQWEYVIKDVETDDYEYQELIFKKYAVDPTYAGQQVLLTDKGKRFAQHDFGATRPEDQIEQIRDMFASQAFQVLRLKGKQRKYLPLLPLKSQVQIYYLRLYQK